MMRIEKQYIIALILMLVATCEDLYALRVPVNGHEKVSSVLKKSSEAERPELILEAQSLKKVIIEYRESIITEREYTVELMGYGLFDKNEHDRALINAYALFMMRINTFLERYVGGRITYIYPFIGPDLIPAMFNETIGMCKDAKDFERGISILKRTEYSRFLDRRSDKNRYLQLDAMDIRSYIDATKSIRGTRVFIIKGFDYWSKEKNDLAVVDKLLKGIFDDILREGDIVLILDREDADRFADLARRSGFAPFVSQIASLYEGIEGVAEDRKMLQMPNALVMMQKKAQIDFLDLTAVSVNRYQI